jgi:hypothetical protein
MIHGSVFFDTKFVFNDGETGEKLFVVLGSSGLLYIVAKTTSRQNGRNVQYGCQPRDRFHNFFLPKGCCYLSKNTWICLDEFYELKAQHVLKKSIDGEIKPVCTLEKHLRALQDCALQSLDITPAQAAIIKSCLA